MSDLSAKQILSNLYGLMMEMNYHRPEEEVAVELQLNPNRQHEKHLLRIRQITAKLKSQQNQSKFEQAIHFLKELKEKGEEELRKLIGSQNEAQLIPLFRKFEEITKEDQAAILEDQEFLHFIEVMKNKLDENQQQ